MHKLPLLFFVLSLSFTVSSNNFYASDERQKEAPVAFVLQNQDPLFLEAILANTMSDAEKLINKIIDDEQLSVAVAKWPTLTVAQQIPLLRKLFALEIESFDITPPQLIIDETSYPKRMVYFDFDLDNKSPGIVYLNPVKLHAYGPYASLAFLLHETRHSAQIQLAFSNKSVLGPFYYAAFTAQKSLKGLGFSDFLTLNNEYEAFLFGNYVLGRLTHWQVDTLNMGTFASQFDQQGKLKINLANLLKQKEKVSLLAQYNEKATAQYVLRSE